MTWTDYLHKVNKAISALTDKLHQMDFIDIYRNFHPKMTECTFLKSSHGAFSEIDHNLGHKTTLSKFKSEIIPSIFFFLPQLYKNGNQL